MVALIKNGVYLYNGKDVKDVSEVNIKDFNPEEYKKNTMTYKILSSHNTMDNNKYLKLKFDALASHDITYVGIIQTARVSGLTSFPMPYVLTNCHNSLCAVGGTINEDDHVFGLSAAKKYGGIYVPAHVAVIHQYMREKMASCGNMILGSDSHTRYGALGTMAIGEGGPELVKQLLGKTYDIDYPEVIAVYLEGRPQKGVGPQDVALAIIGKVFKEGFVKNKVLEFVGPGIKDLSIDFRNGIDVMTTETTCLTSIWITDEKVEEYYKMHNRSENYNKLEPGEITYYDGLVRVDLSKVECMIALPFHPSNAYTIKEFNANLKDILFKVQEEGQKQLEGSKGVFTLMDKIVNGKLMVDQGIVAGCSGGTFENIRDVAAILEGSSLGSDYFNLSIYPASQPIYMDIVNKGIANTLMETGAILKTAFCGPCFGAGDVPSNNGFSIRHTTRNFPNREGSKPSDGQISAVALMDARSIAATALNGGILTPATEINYKESSKVYSFNNKVYDSRVYNGYKKDEPKLELKFGPNIADWPKMVELSQNILLKLSSKLMDAVTTTDELIPSGETSSYRSNPLRLAEFTLSRKDPEYVGRAKEVCKLREKLIMVKSQEELKTLPEELLSVFTALAKSTGKDIIPLVESTNLGSVIYANKPGDGSAREQAASCQKVLGGLANIAIEYATKRYRSNLINWGMLPLLIDEKDVNLLNMNEYVFLPNIKEVIASGKEDIEGAVISKGVVTKVKFSLNNITKDERDIILSGCLMNYYGKDLK
ncbi:MAG TPA: hydratase [Clostridiaceae bacterium]